MAQEIEHLDALLKILAITEGKIESLPFFAKVGEYVKATVKARTLAGLDADNGKFDAYAPTYAEVRAAYGHKTDPVNLKWSGQMFNAMIASPTSRSVRVFFTNSYAAPVAPHKKSNVTNAEKAMYLNKKRRFFALSAKQIRWIIDEWTRTIVIALEGRNG